MEDIYEFNEFCLVPIYRALHSLHATCYMYLLLSITFKTKIYSILHLYLKCVGLSVECCKSSLLGNHTFLYRTLDMAKQTYIIHIHNSIRVSLFIYKTCVALTHFVFTMSEVLLRFFRSRQIKDMHIRILKKKSKLNLNCCFLVVNMRSTFD